MSKPKTHTCLLTANGDYQLHSGKCEFVRVKDATGAFSIIWPDGAIVEVEPGRWFRFPPGQNVTEFTLRDTSGASNTVKIETAADGAISGDDIKSVLGTVTTREAGLATPTLTTVASVTTTVGQKLAANGNRRWVRLQADPANTDWISVAGVTHAKADGARFDPGQTEIWEYTGAIWSVSNSGIQSLRLHEVGP